MSVTRGIIVVVALGYVIGVAGGSDMSEQLPSTINMIGMVVAVIAAFAAVTGAGKKALDKAAQSLD